MQLMLYAIPDEIACKAFPTTISGNAREWFRSLATISMGTFEDLARIFLTHFLGSRERKKPFGYLLTLHHREGESFTKFMIRFNTNKLKGEDPTDGVIFSAIYNGISTKEPVARKIARRQLNNLQELLDKVEEFINEEETLRATRSARKTPKKLEEKKMRDHSGLDTPKPFKKKFNNYNFTLLNANISEVLMEIKKDSRYRRPPRAPQNQNSDHYYEFHEVNGHYTKGCIALRHLTENFIKNGKLVRFLGEQRRVAPSRQNYIREVNYHPSRDQWRLEHYRSRSFDCRNQNGYPWEERARQEEPRRRPACLTHALVVTLTVANHNVHRILVDNGSSANILYWSAFRKLNLGQEKIIPTSCPLMGFTGEQVQLVRSIELLITAGSYPRQVKVMIYFLLVNQPSAYNGIIERMALNELRAITSTLHLKMKFSTDHRVREVRGDQRAARQCYNISMKECPKTLAHGSKCKKDR
ncbi:uncharacterized protein LOC132165069 [Corylus avellana]|uniref:uncharacterized protein LOC132165069 n=1 Tax=Corylus avellana TaxID=13451 RepID=UPI00286C2B25|nr:uncharacterized protein LOC132165069 [Corylus avellana]